MTRAVHKSRGPSWAGVVPKRFLKSRVHTISKEPLCFLECHVLLGIVNNSKNAGVFFQNKLLAAKIASLLKQNNDFYIKSLKNVGVLLQNNVFGRKKIQFPLSETTLVR